MPRTIAPKPPRGHTVIDRESFDKLVYPDCSVDLPEGPGWMTTRAGSTKFCAWIDRPREEAS